MAEMIFCYGTLMFPAVRDALLGKRQLGAQPALLRGWACRRLVRASYPGLVEDAGSLTRGVLLSGLSDADMRILDSYEGDTYVRRFLPVEIGHSVEPGPLPVRAHVYVIAPSALHCVTKTLWRAEDFSQEALQRLLRGL